MDITQGQRVTLKCGDSIGTGTVLLCSDDKEALGVTLDEGGLSTPQGLFVNGVALLLRDGEYHELGTWAVFEIAVTQ